MLVVLSFVVGKLVAGLVRSLLAGVGFDRIPGAVGLIPAGQTTSAPSRWAGTAVLVAIMLFAVTEAAGQLQFNQVSVMVAQFLLFAGQVGLGLNFGKIGADIRWETGFSDSEAGFINDNITPDDLDVVLVDTSHSQFILSFYYKFK